MPKKIYVTNKVPVTITKLSSNLVDAVSALSGELVLEVEFSGVVGLALVDHSFGDLHAELDVTKRNQLAALVVAKVIVKYDQQFYSFYLHIQLGSNAGDFMSFARNVEDSVASSSGLSDEVVQSEGVLVIQFYFLKVYNLKFLLFLIVTIII